MSDPKCDHPEYELESEHGTILYCRVCKEPIALLPKPFSDCESGDKITYIYKDQL